MSYSPRNRLRREFFRAAPQTRVWPKMPLGGLRPAGELNKRRLRGLEDGGNLHCRIDDGLNRPGEAVLDPIDGDLGDRTGDRRSKLGRGLRAAATPRPREQIAKRSSPEFPDFSRGRA